MVCTRCEWVALSQEIISKEASPSTSAHRPVLFGYDIARIKSVIRYADFLFGDVKQDTQRRKCMLPYRILEETSKVCVVEFYKTLPSTSGPS